MNLVFFLLGIIDIFAAALIFYPISDAIVLYVMVYMLAKGGYFLSTGLASRSMGLHCVFLCISDILVGVGLAVMALGWGDMSTAGIVGSYLKAIGTIGLLKGAYTTAFPIFT